MAVQEPPYRVLFSDPPYERRFYPEFVVAETYVPGDFDAASRTGFRRVADYIFGNNVSKSGESQKIAMTAPVTVEPQKDGWRVHFVMPSEKTLDNLPQPKGSDVQLRNVAEHEVAVIRFSGWTTQAAVEEQTKKLTAWMASKGLKMAGVAQVARYNDPFTLPWRRRNEIMIPIEP